MSMISDFLTFEKKMISVQTKLTQNLLIWRQKITNGKKHVKLQQPPLHLVREGVNESNLAIIRYVKMKIP